MSSVAVWEKVPDNPSVGRYILFCVIYHVSRDITMSGKDWADTIQLLRRIHKELVT